VSATTVLLVTGAEAPADLAVLGGLAGVGPATYLSPGDPTDVVVDLVCRRAPATPILGVREVVTVDAAGAWDRLASAGPVAGLLAAARRSPAGRLGLSFSPFDGGRAMWRAVRATPAARGLAERADLVVAVDTEAVRTAWEWRRTGLVPEAYHGMLAAARLLTARQRS
jgi:hypothetical protein